MIIAISLLATLTIAAVSAAYVISLREVLKHLQNTQTVGGEPIDIFRKKVEIAAVQAEILKTKEETRKAIAETRATNIHQ